jgi:EpsI family protein
MSALARRYLIALGLVLAFGGAGEAIRVTRVPPAAYRPDFAAIPLRIGEYQGRDLPIDESVYKFLGAGGMIEREYVGPGAPVRLSVLYASDWRSVHSPEGCYPAQGWELVSNEKVTVPVRADRGEAQPLQARLLRLHKGDQTLLALFSFAYKGGTTPDWAWMGLRVALGPKGAGGLVFTLSTLEKPNAQAARARIEQIFAAAYPKAVEFWYQ